MSDQFGAIIDLIQSMGMILAVVFYVAIVLWTYKDARKRIEDPILIATATATSMLPLIGVFVYMLLRPSEYLADVRERELEIRMMERQLGRQERCPYCKSHIDGDYLSCPVCTTKLRQSCTGCEKPLDPRWVMCPYCETEVPGRSRPASGPRAGGDGEPRRRTRPQEPTSPARERAPKPARSTRAPKPTSAGRGDQTKPSGPPSRADKRTSGAADEGGRTRQTPLRTEPLAPGDGPRTSRGDSPTSSRPDPTFI